MWPLGSPIRATRTPSHHRKGADDLEQKRDEHGDRAKGDDVPCDTHGVARQSVQPSGSSVREALGADACRAALRTRLTSKWSRRARESCAIMSPARAAHFAR